jgi:hypothetical protein
MNIAFCLRGIHYLVPPVNQFEPVDYELSYKNNKKFLYDSINGNIDFFISSYHTVKEKDVIEKFKPVQYVFNDFNKDDDGYKAMLIHTYNCIIMVINEENEKNKKYDLIITTRFDHIFFKYFTEMNIDFNKMNIEMKHSSGNCDDTFWVIPRSLLETFHNAIVSLLNLRKITHEINKFIPENDINYMYIIDETDYKNKTTYHYNVKNNHQLDEFIDSLNKHKNTNLSRNFLLV